MISDFLQHMQLCNKRPLDSRAKFGSMPTLRSTVTYHKLRNKGITATFKILLVCNAIRKYTSGGVLNNTKPKERHDKTLVWIKNYSWWIGSKNSSLPSDDITGCQSAYTSFLKSNIFKFHESATLTLVRKRRLVGLFLCLTIKPHSDTK